MTTFPLISVCMPCYNAGRYVGQALDSVLAQTYPNIEMIVVNDGSKDNCAQVLEQYRGKGVKVVHQENRGQCAAANRAFAESTGEYIKYFDADDLLSPNFIEAQIKRLQGCTDAVASAKWGRFYNDDPATHRIEQEPALWRDMDPADWLVESWISARSMMQCGLWLIPRQVIERVGGWDESLTLNNDFEFFARILCGVREVLFCADAVLYYRSGTPGCLSSSNSRRAYESQCRTLLTGTGHLLTRRNDARARLAVANTCQQGVYDFYPHKDLCRTMEQRIAECGGARLRPAGGRIFQTLSMVMGWKLAKRVTLALAGSRS
jgi:glycosyltransferase involved in cell wall biosynthesis